MQTLNKRKGFSLVELVIVVVIIAIIGAIAIPRMSRGAAGAADSSLVGNLKTIRSAIELYANEHGGLYPGLAADGSTDYTVVVGQLTLYSTDTGTTSATKTATAIYGPYLRSLPALPVGTTRKGSNGIASVDGVGIGWIYNATTGQVNANTTTEADAKGVLYNTY
jgi:prepilin-type N-terminal cleavage/methylation domain-containing protein